MSITVAASSQIRPLTVHFSNEQIEDARDLLMSGRSSELAHTGSGPKGAARSDSGVPQRSAN
jgi:hypothetical protein